jgi:hypothetical protein
MELDPEGCRDIADGIESAVRGNDVQSVARARRG